jgi:hypothetical protein
MEKHQKLMSVTSLRFAYRAALTIGFVLGPLAHTADSRPLVPAERGYLPFSPDLPACNDANVLQRIQSRFHEREAEYWNTGLEILNFDRVAEQGYRTLGEDYIPRRYCQAQALLNNSEVRPVTFTINQDLGFIGYGYGVTWCVAGLDRLDAYAPACKMLAP